MWALSLLELKFLKIFRITPTEKLTGKIFFCSWRNFWILVRFFYEKALFCKDLNQSMIFLKLVTNLFTWKTKVIYNMVFVIQSILTFFFMVVWGFVENWATLLAVIFPKYLKISNIEALNNFRLENTQNRNTILK